MLAQLIAMISALLGLLNGLMALTTVPIVGNVIINLLKSLGLW